ncbi:hypothetical protein I4U23_012581 [Adineta vaga]|nr:hypothetical protein I4U23_012581 [Adineta vaga]
MFKLSTYQWCCWCSVPRVKKHSNAVLHHLTSHPYYQPDSETIPLDSHSVEGTGTEDNPFIIYRHSNLIGRTNLKHLRFVCVSDTHNQIDQIHIPHGDVFIHCGDAVNYKTSSRDIRKFNEFIGTLPHRRKLFVSGNHCVCLNPKRPDQSQKLLSNMIYLQDQLIDIDGVRIYGTPWRPKRGCFYRAEAFGYDPNDIGTDKWSNIPEDIDILLTHTPPYSIRDFNSGCPYLLDEIVGRVRPRIHMFGHMHGGRGASLYRSEDNRRLEGDRLNSRKACLRNCHVPRVRDRPSAVLRHLTHIPPNENNAESLSFNSIHNLGSGTEDDPFIVYRDAKMIGQENLNHLRLVCISDTHNQIHRIHIPNGDVFIHCGDAVRFQTCARDIRVFNNFVGTLPHRYKIFISGNHCICLDPNRPERSREILSNMTYLQDELVDIQGVRIYGSPWRPKRGRIYPAEAFGYDPTLIKEDKWSQIPADIDILLTHGPPYSVRDYHPLTAERIGCPGLLDEVVTRVHPRIHLFGHMHASRGASLYKSEDNENLEGEHFQSGSNDILFVNLAIHQGKTLGEAVVIDYYY